MFLMWELACPFYFGFTGFFCSYLSSSERIGRRFIEDFAWGYILEFGQID